MAEEYFSDEYLAALPLEKRMEFLAEGRTTIDQMRRVLGLLNPPREHIRSAGAGHTQEAGSAHYKAMKIQPIDYIEANELGFHEGNVVKYVTRWRQVDGLKDLEKAEWYIQRLIENERKRLAAEAEAHSIMQRAGVMTNAEARARLE